MVSNIIIIQYLISHPWRYYNPITFGFTPDPIFMINELKSSTEGCKLHIPARRKYRKAVLEPLHSVLQRDTVNHPKKVFESF